MQYQCSVIDLAHVVVCQDILIKNIEELISVVHHQVCTVCIESHVDELFHTINVSVLVDQLIAVEEKYHIFYFAVKVSINEDSSGTLLRGTVFISVDGGQKLTEFCSNSFNEWTVGNVVCRQLGHGPVISARKGDFYWVDSPTLFSACSGSESTLSDCVFVLGGNDLSECTGDTLKVECLPGVAEGTVL